MSLTGQEQNQDVKTDIPGPDLDLRKISEEAMRRVKENGYSCNVLGEGGNQAVVLTRPVLTDSDVNYVIISPKFGFGCISYHKDDPKKPELENLLESDSSETTVPQKAGVYTHTIQGADFHLVIGGSGHAIKTDLEKDLVLNALDLNREKSITINPVVETYKLREKQVADVIDLI